MSTPQFQPPYQGYAPAPAKTNSLAIAALVSSFFISLLGVILGHIALNQIKTTGEGGRGLAIAFRVLDELSYRRDDEGNHWTLVHRITP